VSDPNLPNERPHNTGMVTTNTVNRFIHSPSSQFRDVDVKRENAVQIQVVATDYLNHVKDWQCRIVITVNTVYRQAPMFILTVLLLSYPTYCICNLLPKVK
jgi:hypothetical protein